VVEESRSGEMKSIAKAVNVVAHVVGLFVGSGFTTPVTQVLEQNPDLGTF